MVKERGWGLPVKGGREHSCLLLSNTSTHANHLFFSTLTELSLTVPITNSLAFLFTVLGEWWAEGKIISRGTLRSSLAHCRLFQPHISVGFSSTCLLSTLRDRYLDWHGVCPGRYCALRSVEECVMGWFNCFWRSMCTCICTFKGISPFKYTNSMVEIPLHLPFT